MLKRTYQSETQQETPTVTPVRVCQYGPPPAPGFEFMFRHHDAKSYLQEQEYRELPGNVGILKSYISSDEKLAHRFAVFVDYPDEAILILMREYAYPNFMREYSPLVGILPKYLPWFENQAWLPKLP
jgi:hypothetical protein